MRHFAPTLVVLLFALSCIAQESEPPERFVSNPKAPVETPYTSLIDPACPVSWVPGLGPSTAELRVLYYPMGLRAKIKDPRSLTLHAAFGERETGHSRIVPFTRMENGVWEAKIPLGHEIFGYGAYWVEDTATKQIDNNGGKYWDIFFCNLEGERQESSIEAKARSYTGSLRDQGIDRPVDYAEALNVLQSALKPENTRYPNLQLYEWSYKHKLYGDTPEGRQKLIAELGKYIDEHLSDGVGLMATNNFVVDHQDWLPPEMLEKLWSALDGKMPGFNPRQYAERFRIENEPDKSKRLTLLRLFVSKYPDNPETMLGLQSLFWDTDNLEEKEQVVARLTKDPGNDYFRAEMARAYLRAGKNFPRALALIDAAEKVLDEQYAAGTLPPWNPDTGGTVDDSYSGDKQQLAFMRAELLLRMGKARQSLAILQPLRPKIKDSDEFFLFGQALQATGNNRAALDAYLESVVRPSKCAQQHNEALARLWHEEHFGTDEELEHRIATLAEANFRKENYVPRLASTPAPAFDLFTLKGERLSSAALRGKKVILNFWAPWCAPCVIEMPALQEYQRKHPEVVVLAVVGPGSTDEEIARTIRTRKLDSLRIAKTTQQLLDAFGVQGIPHTFVIDEAGVIRVHHYGDITDVERYLDADVKAIDNGVPSAQSQRASATKE